MPKKNALNIPKKFWTFWNSPKLPVTVENCVKTWQFLNPDYEINIINTKNVDDWIPEVGAMDLYHGKDSYARLSDYIRVNVLYKYGGIWIDASVICTQSFDDWFASIKKKRKDNPVEFIGFYSNQFTTRPRYRVIENWTFACVKHSKFVRKWRNEFMKLESYDEVQDWLDDMEELGVDFQDIPKYDDPDYLAQHIAAQKVLQKDKHPQKGMVLINAENTALKYRLYRSGRLSVEQRVARLCKDYKFWAESPIIKFTGEDRAVMEKNKKIRNCVFNHWKNMIATILTGVETG